MPGDSPSLLADLLPDLRIAPAMLMAVAASLVAIVALAVAGRIPLKYNLRNLAVRWWTTAMTALAFTLVVLLMVVMMAFVNGMYRLTETSGHPGNVIILSEGTTDESFSTLGFSDVGDIENQRGIVRQNGRPLCSRETYMIVNQPIPDAPPGRHKRRFLQVRGLDDPGMAARVHERNLLPGGAWFSPAGVRELPGGATAIEVVLGEGIARELALDRPAAARASARNKTRLDVGDTIELGGRPWIVVGLTEATGATFDSEVWAKRSIVGPLFGKETYSSLVLRTPSAEEARRLAEFFNTRYTKAVVKAIVETEYFAGLSATSRQFLVAIVAVAVIMAVGGAFGVMNTMFAAVSQRTADIGVLRILGYQRWQILISFLLESLAIALVGGALGCAAGYLADGWTANSMISGGQGGGAKFVVFKLVVDLNTLGLGMLLALGMGALGGALPAMSAMWHKPLESLR
jgi:putative ABC transport system permease protein